MQGHPVVVRYIEGHRSDLPVCREPGKPSPYHTRKARRVRECTQPGPGDIAGFDVPTITVAEQVVDYHTLTQMDDGHIHMIRGVPHLFVRPSSGLFAQSVNMLIPPQRAFVV
jgi:hypothetical protein